MLEFLINNWEYVILGLLMADKIVAMTPTKYDDLILSSFKGFLKIFTGKTIDDKKA